jgi:glycerophosphoryl diester phosphodiesterase
MSGSAKNSNSTSTPTPMSGPEPVPQLVAHRGYLLRYPENTWMALEAALRAGACWLEFDIQMCADGRFVLLHDADFLRTSGHPGSVFSASTTSIQQISVHEPERFDGRFAPVEPSFLDPVLESLSAFPACRKMVEIKHESLEHWGVRRVMETLLDTLEGYAAGCVVISYRLEALRYARQRSDLEIGWVLGDYDETHRSRAEELRPDYLICNEIKVPGAGRLWPGPWRWMLYDIVDPQVALAWARRGASLIETADIDALLQHPALAQSRCRHGL